MRHNWESNPRFSCLCGFLWTHYGPKVDGRKKKKKKFSWRLKALVCVFCRDSWKSPETHLVILSLPNSHRQTHTMMGCWRWPLHTVGRLPWTHNKIGRVTGNKNERGQRKIEKWEKLRDRRKLWCVICDKSSWAVKAFELTLVWTGRSLIWRFIMEKPNGLRLSSDRMMKETKKTGWIRTPCADEWGDLKNYS